MRRLSETVWLGRLTPNVWVHTTTHALDDGTYYPANGALVTDAEQTLLIDTGWNDAATVTILSAWKRLRLPPVSKALVTHFHYDRLGGIGALARCGIPAFGNPLTIGLAIDNGLRPPQPLHAVEKHARRLGAVEVFYPGPGHTLDNVVVWVPRDGVLFGGCLVKATTAPDLGNLADGDVPAYAATTRAVARRYKPRRVIPGHGTLAGDSLTHTIALADGLVRHAR